jgi:hypothetical protein
MLGKEPSLGGVQEPTRAGSPGQAELGKRRRCGTKGLLLRPERCAADQRQAFDETPVAGLAVGILAFQGEAGFNDEVHGGLVLKTHIDRVITTGGENFNHVHGLAGSFRKTIEGTARIATDGGLAAFGFGEAERGRKALAFLCFLCSAGTSMRPDAGLMGFGFRFGCGFSFG